MNITGLPSKFVKGNKYGWWVRVYGPNGYGDLMEKEGIYYQREGIETNR